MARKTTFRGRPSVAGDCFVSKTPGPKPVGTVIPVLEVERNGSASGERGLSIVGLRKLSVVGFQGTSRPSVPSLNEAGRNGLVFNFTSFFVFFFVPACPGSTRVGHAPGQTLDTMGVASSFAPTPGSGSVAPHYPQIVLVLAHSRFCVCLVALNHKRDTRRLSMGARVGFLFKGGRWCDDTSPPLSLSSGRCHGVVCSEDPSPPRCNTGSFDPGTRGTIFYDFADNPRSPLAEPLRSTSKTGVTVPTGFGPGVLLTKEPPATGGLPRNVVLQAMARHSRS